MERNDYRYLCRVDSPDDLKRLSDTELELYCGELRSFIIESLASNPGHLGASLGAVELAAAIHYVYDTTTFVIAVNKTVLTCTSINVDKICDFLLYNSHFQLPYFF